MNNHIQSLIDQLEYRQVFTQSHVFEAAYEFGYCKIGDHISSLDYMYNPQSYWDTMATIAMLILAAEGEL